MERKNHIIYEKKEEHQKDVILELADDLCHGCRMTEFGGNHDQEWTTKYIHSKRYLDKSKNIELPYEIEHIYPDYSIYGITDTAYGFLTRGCPRGCPFCIVAGKEGQQSRKVADLSEWWSGQKNIKLLDPNLLACSSHMELMHQLIESGANIDITQGLDIRLLNDDNLQLINNMKIKMLHFAWDNPNDKSTQQALQKFREKSIIDARKVGVYVLTNYWSTLEDDLKRIYWLRDNGYSPYVMIYDKDHAPVEIRLLQRWVNNKIIFKSVDKFEDYDRRIG